MKISNEEINIIYQSLTETIFEVKAARQTSLLLIDEL